MRYVLASQSPRRRELFGLIVPHFEVAVPDVDESVPEGTAPAETVEILALRKARAAARDFPADTVIVGSDTVVAVAGDILGKPEDPDDAAGMLRMLSGRVHSVFTGVAVLFGRMETVFSEETRVEFYELEDSLIDRYVATGEPMDKAGAYGIQEYGSMLVRRIDGDFFTVMGLPVARLYRVLRGFDENL